MAKRYSIYETAGCFKVKNETQHIENESLWGECKITISSITQNKGVVGIELIQHPNYSINPKFQFGFIAQGEYHHEDNFGKIFNIGWKIIDSNGNDDILIIHGGDWTNSWGDTSVAKGLEKFLNELYQFETINDFKLYQDLKDDSSWKNKDIEDKIILLADVINIVRNYNSINPATYCIATLKEELYKKIKKLIAELK